MATDTSSPATQPVPVRAPAARVATALDSLRLIWPRGAGCEHRHAATAFVELEAAQTDLNRPRADAATLATLASIADTTDAQCNAEGAWRMRTLARQALGIPAPGHDRDPVQPASCGQIPEPAMPTRFTDSRSMTGEQQVSAVNAFSAFLAGGCRERDFTASVYHLCTRDLGFIAHYDRRQFYQTYFRSWDGAEEFANGISRAYGTRNWGAAEHRELKTALYCLARIYGVRPGGADAATPTFLRSAS